MGILNNNQSSAIYITGQFLEVVNYRNGVSTQTGNSWASAQLLVRQNDKNQTIACIEMFGDDKISAVRQITAGSPIKCKCYLHFSQYTKENGQVMYFPKVDLNDVDLLQGGQMHNPMAQTLEQALPQPQSPAPLPTETATQYVPQEEEVFPVEDGDDLPF